MKPYFFSLTIIALAIWRVQAAEPNLQTNNLEMTISLKDNLKELAPGQEFILLVRYRNGSTNQTFTMYDFNQSTLDPFGGIGVTVISPSGRDISPHYNPGSGSGVFVHIAPNETRENQIKLTDFIKFTEPGVYRITAKKTFMSGHQKTGETISNSLKVSVVP